MSKKPNKIKPRGSHNTELSDATYAGQAGGGSQARCLTRVAALIELCLIKTSVSGSFPEGDQNAEKPLTENSSGFSAFRLLT